MATRVTSNRKPGTAALTGQRPDPCQMTHLSQPRSSTSNGDQLAGGDLLSAISEAIVAKMRAHYGRGPTKAKTYILDDMVICVLRDDGLIPLEQTLIEGGKSDRVLEMRRDFQALMRDSYQVEIERLTGRRVVAFMTQVHVDPDLTLGAFLLDGSTNGNGQPASPADTRTAGWTTVETRAERETDGDGASR